MKNNQIRGNYENPEKKGESEKTDHLSVAEKANMNDSYTPEDDILISEPIGEPTTKQFIKYISNDNEYIRLKESRNFIEMDKRIHELRRMFNIAPHCDGAQSLPLAEL
jgi:hypothetical protein